MADVHGQPVVVMGGTSGIGLATSRLLASAGACVTVTGRDASKLGKAILGTPLRGQVVDSRSASAVNSFMKQAGTIDHLVLTLSGAEGGGPFRGLDLDRLRRGFEDKFFAQVTAAQASLDFIRRDGSITFVTAISARRANPNTSGLAAINGALESMVRVLASELRPLRVNAVSPGVIDTPWWNRVTPEQKARMFEELSRIAAVGRVGTPEEVAEAIAFVVRNTFVTGTIIECDGGLRLV